MDDISLPEALQKAESELKLATAQKFIVTPNPEMCLYTTGDERYRRDILDRAFLALPDGFGLKIGAWVLGERLRHRVTGVDFTYGLMERAAGNGWRVFLLGGEEGVADRCAEVLMRRYEGLKVVEAFDGWKTQNSKLNPEPRKFSGLGQNHNLKLKTDALTSAINKAKPDILLVALGAPKQEKWIAENLPKLPSVKLAIGVGGTFDFISGLVRRAPRFMRALGFEWLWRLLIQPWRFRRIFNATIKFIATVLKWRLRMWFVYRSNVVGLIVKDDKVLLVERADEPGHWQLPQGGIDRGEEPRGAFFREMKEEIGIDALSIISHIPRFFRYVWPKINQLMQGYRGQRQDLFIAEFKGEDEDIKLDQDELVSFRWVSRDEALSLAHPVRKEQLNRALLFLPQH